MSSVIPIFTRFSGAFVFKNRLVYAKGHGALLTPCPSGEACDERGRARGRSRSFNRHDRAANRPGQHPFFFNDCLQPPSRSRPRPGWARSCSIRAALPGSLIRAYDRQTELGAIRLIFDALLDLHPDRRLPDACYRHNPILGNRCHAFIRARIIFLSLFLPCQ